MNESMIILPRTETDDETRAAVLSLLRERCDDASHQSDELYDLEHTDHELSSELARTLLAAAASISAVLDDGEDELDLEQACTALAIIDPLCVEATRMVYADDLRCAIDDESFDAVAPSATALCSLAMVGYVEFIPGNDIQRIIEANRCAPTPIMHALFAVVTAGYLRGRAAAAHDSLRLDLTADLSARLDESQATERWHDPIVSPFVTASRFVCESTARRWSVDQDAHAVRSLARARAAATSDAAATLAYQQELLGRLPDLAAFFDVGHGYGIIETLLHDLAHQAGVVTPLDARAPLWLDLLLCAPFAPESAIRGPRFAT